VAEIVSVPLCVRCADRPADALQAAAALARRLPRSFVTELHLGQVNVHGFVSTQMDRIVLARILQAFPAVVSLTLEVCELLPGRYHGTRMGRPWGRDELRAAAAASRITTLRAIGCREAADLFKGLASAPNTPRVDGMIAVEVSKMSAERLLALVGSATTDVRVFSNTQLHALTASTAPSLRRLDVSTLTLSHQVAAIEHALTHFAALRELVVSENQDVLRAILGLGLAMHHAIVVRRIRITTAPR
jgi:hypothetical protein